jgi:hypothetical protein
MAIAAAATAAQKLAESAAAAKGSAGEQGGGGGGGGGTALAPTAAAFNAAPAAAAAAGAYTDAAALGGTLAYHSSAGNRVGGRVFVRNPPSRNLFVANFGDDVSLSDDPRAERISNYDTSNHISRHVPEKSQTS